MLVIARTNAVRVSSAPSCVSNKTPALFPSSGEKIIPRELISPSLPRGRRKEEDTKGALTLSSDDKGPILGLRAKCPGARQWQRTPDEKYPGLKTDGIFADEEERVVIRRWEPGRIAPVRGRQGTGKNLRKAGMQRGCKSGENLISRDKSLNVPRSSAGRCKSGASLGMSSRLASAATTF